MHKYNNEIIKGVKNAGSIFIGKFSPEAMGDYIAGPNHVLPPLDLQDFHQVYLLMIF